MKPLLLAGLAGLLIACATVHPVPPAAVTPALVASVPVDPPIAPAPSPRPYDGHVRFLASWLPNAGPDGSASFTHAQMLTMDCDDPSTAAAALRSRAEADGRAILLHSGLMGWGNAGYAVVDDATLATCWALERQFIRDYRSRVLEVHTADEPPDVAWSYWVNGTYDPNRYNADLATICAIVHADFADLPCAVNYGSVPAGLVIPAGLNHVWLETYDADWHAKLDALAALTSAPLALMPPGFVAGDPAQLDAQKAALVQAEWTEAQANPRVTALVFFLWCCDDTVTGDKNFYTLSGGRLPRTLAALQAVGAAVAAR